MNVSTKRLLSILLSLAMILAMLPLSVFAADAPTTLYVKPNENWLSNNARFAAYFFGNGETWVDCTLVADGIYEVAVPAGYPNVIFCRMNPGTTANNWNNKWNQTSDLKVPTDGTNCYAVADGSWDNGKGQWTTYTPDGGVGETETTTASPIEFSVAGSAELCGTGWTPEDINNMMTDEDGDGIYTITYSEVAAGSYEFKVTDGTWGASWGKDGGESNYVLDLPVLSNVTINFYSAEKSIEVITEYLEELPSTEPTEPAPVVYYVAGNFNGWNSADEAYLMVANEDGTYSLTFAVTADKYALKVTDGTWDNSWGGLGEGGNYEFTAFTDGEITVTFDGTTVMVSGDCLNGEEPVEPEVPAVKEYCLVGFINGANYGCDEDWENVGEYIFVDGTLSTSFTADSYVFVKTTDSVNWYLAEAYCTETTCTFVNGGTEKLFVPGNVELTFTLTENEDGSLTVSYETGAEIPTEPTEPSEPEAPAAYYVTGDFAEWNPADEAYLMAANEDGTYSLTFAITAGDHALKVTNGTWDSSWGGWGEGGNYEFTAVTDGEITVTFDGTTVMVSGDCLKTEEPSEPEAPATYYVTGDFAEWNPADEAFLMNVNEDGTYSLTFAVTAGKHSLKVTNGTWDSSWGGLGEGGNYEINATTDGEITVTFDGTTVMVSGDCLGEIEAEPLTITSMHVAGAAGLTGVEWDPTANKMDCAMGVYTITFTGVAAGTYEYKFVANGTGDWDLNWASGLETVSGETYTAYFKALGNSSVVVAEDNSTVTLTFNMTTMDIVTGEGATCSALVEAPAADLGEALVIGDNALSLEAGDLDGNTWNFTATEDGTLTLNVTALAYDWLGEGEYTEAPAEEIAMGWPRLCGLTVNGVNYYSLPAEVAVSAGDVVIITITSHMAYATNLTLALSLGEPTVEEPAEPGSAENPIVIETLPYEITVEGKHDLFYTYIAETDGVLAITKPEDNYVSNLPNFVQKGGTYYVTVTAGDVISINPWGSNAGVYTIAYGEMPEAEDVSVYFDASLFGWTNVNAYAWDAEGNMFTEEWPGSAMTQNEDGIWTIELSDSAAFILFNDGNFQTADLDFYGDYIYNGVIFAPYGTEITTDLYVTGDGAFGEWTSDANIMTNNGDGTFTATFTGIEAGNYGIKITDGTWINSWGFWGENFPIELTETSDVVITFSLNTLEITYEAVATPSIEPSVIPTLTAKYPTVSFEDVIILNIYFDAKNTQDVKDMGLLLFPEKYAAADIALAEEVLPGYVWNEGAKLYTASTNGIAAKELGKTIYFAVYAELADGTYAYSVISSYSVEKYAKTQLTSASTTAEMKALMVATLNYAAAAQVKFEYNVDALVNASLTDEQKALNVAYSADMITVADKPEGAKLGDMVKTGNYKKFYPTVSFEGAFSINYYFAPTTAPVGDITMYVWTQADYDAAESLSKENASYALTMELLESGEYRAIVENIAAKQLNDALYVSICYNDGTTDYCSGVTGYSIGLYCKAQAAKTGAMAELAKATAVYGYYAKQRFG